MDEKRIPPSWYTKRRRPHWWPQNEPWPPTRPIWKHNRVRFFRRMGMLVVATLVAPSLIFAFALAYVARWLGIIQFSASPGWIVPLILGVLLIAFGVFLVLFRVIRHYSAPFTSLLDASEKVAHGDYAARARESGPTELRSLSRAFNSMAARLQKADEQRRKMLADVTHELRTPLTIIQGSVEGMLDGVYPADEAHLKSILDETHLLSRLVDDLRTLALAESGALQLNKEPLEPAELLGDTAAAFRPQAEAKGVDLRVEAAAAAPPVEVDAGRMREVLGNLVANALRYTPAGGSITLRCELTGSPEHARICVCDTGPGIAPEDLPHVFERFYKTRDSGGMGLGMAIARSMVEAHGGTIHAESPPGQGTTIVIDLP